MAAATNNRRNLETADKVMGQHGGAWLLRQETRATVLLEPRKPNTGRYCAQVPGTMIRFLYLLAMQRINTCFH